MTVLIYAEQKNGKVLKASLNAIGAGAALARAKGLAYNVLLLGPKAQEAAAKIGDCGAAKLLYSEHAALDPYLDEVYAQAVTQVAKREAAQVVLGVSTTQGKAILPAIATLLEAGMASDVIAITERQTYLRPIYAGNLNAEVQIETPVHVLSLRGTSFAPYAPAGQVAATDAALDLTPGFTRKKFVGFAPVVSARPPLTEAPIVVSVGRGIKGPENLPLAEALADLLGGAIGASRAVVDSGWLPNDFQVGQTGKVVAPKVYIALGLSGAIQHLAGMKDSKVIVAVNKDEEAPIFSVADYGLVADLFAAVPELTGKLKAAKGA